ncbi:hypothetical protein HJFPF1_04593 [Paramyrothecium foliicola]|nr:hypothetical protein HJFPF1_04593 [Paramyrothecium foliicola]
MAPPDFSDRSRFPSVAELPPASADALPSEEKDSWWLIAQIKDKMTITQPTLVATDRAGADFALTLDEDHDSRVLEDAAWRKGNCVAVRGARRTEGRSGTPFVKVARGRAAGGDVRVVPGGWAALLGLAEQYAARGGEAASVLLYKTPPQTRSKHPTTSKSSFSFHTATMTGNYIITESSPSTTTYMRSGRGGMGNTFRATPTTVRSSVPSTSAQPSLSSSSSSAAAPQRFFSGIGGAGNIHSASERPALSLDDDFRRAAARDAAPVGYTGIGGWGNVYRRKKSDASDASSATSTAGDDASSETSSMTTKSKMWARAVSSVMHRS